MNRIVVTGATSMLGIALIQECIRNNTEVLAIVRIRSPHLGRLPSSALLRVVSCDLADLSRFPVSTEQDQKCVVFYHFGWRGTDKKERDNPDTQLENVKYTLDAVRLAHRLGCRVFVGAGSQAEYGRTDADLTPETPVHPESAYGITKFAASKLSLLLAKDLGMIHVWARVLSVYGPYDGEHTMIMSGIRQLLSGERPKYTKGEQMWDYLYCEDAARAFYLMGEKAKGHAVYCLGSGIARPIRDYITLLRNAVDPTLEVELGEIEYPDNQVMHLCANIQSLSTDTGFVPRIPFETGIKKTIEWYKETMNQ